MIAAIVFAFILNIGTLVVPGINAGFKISVMPF
jgi:Ca2+-transporting ATPase